MILLLLVHGLRHWIDWSSDEARRLAMRAGQGSTDPPSRVEFAFDGKGLLHISGQCIGRHPVTWATGQPVLKEVFL